MDYYLAEDAQIVHSPEFESGCLKIHNNFIGTMTDAEKEAVSSLIIANPSSGDDVDDSMLTYLEKIEHHKRQHLEEMANIQYMDIAGLPATSCTIEHLFSHAKLILTDLHRRTSPLLFEAILFLKVNHNLWNANDVAKAMKHKVADSTLALDDDLFCEEDDEE